MLLKPNLKLFLTCLWLELLVLFLHYQDTNKLASVDAAKTPTENTLQTLVGVKIPIEFGLGFTTDAKYTSRSTEDQIKIIDKLVALTKRFLVSNDGLADVVNKYAILKPVIAKRVKKFIVTFDPKDSAPANDKYKVTYDKVDTHI